MTKDELLAKIQEICPSAIFVDIDHGDEEICIATGLVEYSKGKELISIEDYNPEPAGKANQEAHYFAEDGTFGDANNLTIIETSNWNEDDWAEIDDTPDWDRPRTAKIINNKYKKN
jgi:hypothetical protein